MVVGDSSTVGENSLKYSVKICARFLMVIIMLILSARSKQLKISDRIIDVDLKQIYTVYHPIPTKVVKLIPWTLFC